MRFDSGSTWFVSYMLMDTFHIAFYDDFSFHGVCYDIICTFVYFGDGFSFYGFLWPWMVVCTLVVGMIDWCTT